MATGHSGRCCYPCTRIFTPPRPKKLSRRSIVFAPAERQATLVREAKNERSVVWYAPMNREDLRQFTSAFEAEYPFLKVEILTGGPQSLLNRIMTEHRAGKYNYDTLNVRSSALYTLKKANAIMRFDTPNRRALRTGFTDKEGYQNGIWASLLVYLYNSKQVPRAQAPKSIDDLLQPRWKGKLGMDKDADDWLAAIMDYYGDERGKQIARGLGAQQLNIRKGRTLVSQLVAAGEFPVQIDAHHHEAVALKQSRRADRLYFSRTFRARQSCLFVRAVVTPAPSACRGALGRLHGVEKRPGNRLPPNPLARAQRSRHRRPRRSRQPQNRRAGCRQMGREV